MHMAVERRRETTLRFVTAEWKKERGTTRWKRNPLQSCDQFCFVSKVNFNLFSCLYALSERLMVWRREKLLRKRQLANHGFKFLLCQLSQHKKLFISYFRCVSRLAFEGKNDNICDLEGLKRKNRKREECKSVYKILFYHLTQYEKNFFPCFYLIWMDVEWKAEKVRIERTVLV